MKNLFWYIAPLLIGLGFTQSASAQSGIVGNWLTEDRSAHVQIYPVGGKYAGKMKGQFLFISRTETWQRLP